MPLIQWIMNLLEKPPIRGKGGVLVSGTAKILESFYAFDGSGFIYLDSLTQSSFKTFGSGNFRQIIQYAVGDLVYDLNGNKWQVIDFHAYGSKETEYTVKFGDVIRKYKDSELSPYIDLGLRINCLNILQYCLNNHEFNATAYSPGLKIFKYDVGEEVYDLIGNKWLILNVSSSTDRENKYECRHANFIKSFYESELYQNKVDHGLDGMIMHLNKIQTALNHHVFYSNAIVNPVVDSSVRFEIGDMVFDRSGRRWFVSSYQFLVDGKTQYYCVNETDEKYFTESQLTKNFSNDVLQEKISCLNALQTCLNNFKDRNGIE